LTHSNDGPRVSAGYVGIEYGIQFDKQEEKDARKTAEKADEVKKSGEGRT
jgi:hypothetical protein